MNELNDTSSNQLSILNPQNMDSLTRFAELMAQSNVTVPSHLRGNPADCMAIAMQAVQWGMNPFAVAQKTHLVNGVLGYEAQLVNAVLSSSTAITGRPKYEYSDGWDALSGKVEMKQNRSGKTIPASTWTAADEVKLWVRVGAVLSGETDITWGQKVYLANITTRNSPLWVTAPAQQIAYLALKYWSRLYTPDVILGVYDKEALEQPLAARQEKEINPQSSAQNLNTMFSDTKKEPEKEPPAETPEYEEVTNIVTVYDEITGHIDNITDGESYNLATKLYNDAVKGEQCSNEEYKKLHAALAAALNKING